MNLVCTVCAGPPAFFNSAVTFIAVAGIRRRFDDFRHTGGDHQRDSRCDAGLGTGGRALAQNGTGWLFAGLLDHANRELALDLVAGIFEHTTGQAGHRLGLVLVLAADVDDDHRVTGDGLAGSRLGVDDRAGGDGGVHHRLFGYAQAHVFQGLLGILSHHVFRLGDRNILGAQAHGQGDLLALLDSTAGLGVLLDDGAGGLVGIFFLFLQFQQRIILRSAELILGHADEADEGDVVTVGEKQVAGVGEDQINQDSGTDDKSDRHAKENGQQRERLLAFFLLILFAAAGVLGAHTTGFFGADIAAGLSRCLGSSRRFCGRFCAVYHAVDIPFRVVLGVAVLIRKAGRGVAFESLDGFQHFLGALVAVGRVLFHGFFGDLAQGFGHVGGHLRQRLGLIGDLHDGDGHSTIAVKWQLAGEHLVQHNAH